MLDKKNYNNKWAFTLAEVLITLTIIGVIAALTIPNLLQRHSKHEIEVGVKEAYNIISNAMKMSQAENGPSDEWVFTESTDFAQKYVISYLKIQHTCGKSITDKNCFKRGYWYYMNGESAASNNGYGSDFFYKVKLDNGMTLGIWAMPSTHINKPSFLFDVNGGRGTSTAGVDVFSFLLDREKKGIVRAGFGAWDANTLNTIDYFYTLNTNGRCDPNYSSMAGMQCAKVLQLNNWTFPDNYPIKKF